jgi:hypothetical protein
MRLLRLSALLAFLLSVVSAPAAEFPDAAQPRLAPAGGDRVFLAFGQGADVFVIRSDDRGATFGAPVKVATVPGLMLGMRRGPRIAAHGDTVTVTLNQKELLAYSSADAGLTWTGPVIVNDVPTSAREGLHDLALSPDGRVFITWLDLRLGKMALFAAESTDAGRTWTPNTPIYRSPEISICECCHPSVHFDAAGNLAVMFRNSLDGSRDLWLMTRPAGAKEFSTPRKQGEGTWKLKGCPMDGGDILPGADGQFASVWQRDGEIFFQAPTGPERSIARGKQPIAAPLTAGALLVWQQGPDLWSATLPASSRAPVTPALIAASARSPVIVALPDHRGTVIAFEKILADKSVATVVERL